MHRGGLLQVVWLVPPGPRQTLINISCDRHKLTLRSGWQTARRAETWSLMLVKLQEILQYIVGCGTSRGCTFRQSLSLENTKGAETCETFFDNDE